MNKSLVQENNQNKTIWPVDTKHYGKLPGIYE